MTACSKWSFAAAVIIGWTWCPSLHAAEDESRQLGREEIEAYLAGRSLPNTRQDSADVSYEEAPKPEPRRQGVVVEGGVGALGHVGTMRTVSPVAPRFFLQVGYEPLRWLMFFGETDITVGNTNYAQPPPEPRAYVLYGFGAGVRFTVTPGDRVGIFAQGSLGTSRVSSDVLDAYGYEAADTFNAYLGGLLGAELYPVNPHYALCVSGGVRAYPDGFERERSSQLPLAWLGSAALRYTF